MTNSASPADWMQHETVLAAAGSGKTYQLTSRYLQLLHLNAPPSSILATTFTRLAAGEIRNRIVQRLIDALDNPEAHDELSAQLRTEISDEQIICLIRALVQHADAMQIRTVDSFFAAIVRSFALELGLPAVGRIVDSDQLLPLHREALRQMLDEREADEFIKLFRRFTQGDVRRSVTGAIDSVVSKLYDLFRDTKPDAWKSIPARPELDRSEVIALAETIAAYASKAGTRLANASSRDANAIRTHNWEHIVGCTIFKNCRAGNPTYYSAPLPDGLADAYLRIGEHASAVLTNRAGEQTLATHKMLTLYHEQLSRLKRAHGLITFSDLTFRLLNHSDRATLEDVWYRLDGRINHVLLDEFQDTSTAQWRVLHRMVEEIVSTRPPERSFFCVGDMKQSIYGWRHAEPRLLAELPELLGSAAGSPVTSRTISCTRRSAQPIVDAVNLVFSGLVNTHVGQHYPDACELWERGFTQHTTANAQPGYAELREVPYVSDSDEREPRRDAAAVHRITELCARNPALKIGVLTRDNKTVTRLSMKVAAANPQINISGYGGTPLCDSTPVNAILDVLQMADHPRDTAAAFHIARTPAVRILHSLLQSGGDSAADEMHLLFERENGARLRGRIANEIRRQLLERGMGAVIGEWVGLLLPDCDARQARRLTQLSDIARSWLSTSWHPIADFIDFVERRRVADVVQANVEIMTVHQAKGLEWDVVVLPELEESFAGLSPIAAYHRDAIDGPITKICRYMNRDTRAGLSEVEPLFRDDELRRVRDGLSLLYVAMTRARRGLYMIVDGRRGDSPIQTMAGLLRAQLATAQHDEPHVLYRAGDDGWIDEGAGEAKRASAHEKRPQEKLPPVKDDDAANLFTMADAGVSKVERPTDVVRIRFAPMRSGYVRAEAAPPPSALKEHARPLQAKLGWSDDGAFEHGTAVHALFQQIEWLDEFEQSDAALLAVVQQCIPHRSEAWALQRVARFRQMLQQPVVRAALSRSASEAIVTVECELQVARLLEGRPQWSIIDRMVVEREAEGSPPGAIRIIDYKTDAIDAGRADEAARQYRGQIRAYREAAAEQYRVDQGIVTAQLLFVTADVLIDVD